MLVARAICTNAAPSQSRVGILDFNYEVRAAQEYSSSPSSVLWNVMRQAAFFVLAVWSIQAFAGSCNVVNGKAYGDCEGIRVNTEPSGRLVVTSAVTETGMISGALVKRGGYLKLSGMSTGDIKVEAGATLEVNGTVNGTITNNGGTVRINGTVRLVRMNGGSLDVSGVIDSVKGNGKITYRKDAVVGGKPIN